MAKASRKAPRKATTKNSVDLAAEIRDGLEAEMLHQVGMPLPQLRKLAKHSTFVGDAKGRLRQAYYFAELLLRRCQILDGPDAAAGGTLSAIARTVQEYQREVSGLAQSAELQSRLSEIRALAESLQSYESLADAVRLGAALEGLDDELLEGDAREQKAAIVKQNRDRTMAARTIKSEETDEKYRSLVHLVEEEKRGQKRMSNANAFIRVAARTGVKPRTVRRAYEARK